MHRGGGKRFGQGQNIGLITDVLPFCVFQSLFKRGARFEPHTASNSRFPCAYDINCAGMLFRQMATTHHTEAMEGMEGVCKAVFADVFLLGGKVFAIPVHIR